MVVFHRSTCCSYIPSMAFKFMDIAPTVVGWPCVCIVRQAHGLALCVRRMLSWHSHSSNVWWCVTTYVQEPRCSQAYMPHPWNYGTVASLRPAFPHRGQWHRSLLLKKVVRASDQGVVHQCCREHSRRLASSVCHALGHQKRWRQSLLPRGWQSASGQVALWPLSGGLTHPKHQCQNVWHRRLPRC